MTPATTVAFVKAFENRYTIMGCNDDAQNVTKFLNQANVTIDIVKNYGQIAEEDLKIGRLASRSTKASTLLTV